MKTAKAKGGGGRSGVPTLDLHGYRVEEVFDAVEAFLRKHANADRVRIMPGKGTGKVQSEVARYLKLGNYSWSHERSGAAGAANSGVMIVHMD
ncbi:MAG: Smr/MutS family protein [Bdellovibrionaceae bacterium]|nr:Smr/MutS family protein [Pseudobdellovibrionaceae bacterium]